MPISTLLAKCRQIPEKQAGAIYLALFVLVYHMLFFNKFFPIQEGWFSVYAHYMNNGAVPYRDFWMFLPPLYPLKIAALTDIFGDNLIVFRIYALLERIVLVLFIYAAYLKLFSPRNSFLAALLSLAMYAGTTVDVLYSYYQTCLLLGVIAVYQLLVYLERGEGDWRVMTAGFFAGLSFACKQSTGLFIAAAIPAAIVFTSYGFGARKVSRLLAIYSAFLFAALAPFAAWLYHNGAFSAFISQVFLGGAASKGSLPVALFGFFKIVFAPKYLLGYLVIAGAVYLLSSGARGEAEVSEAGLPSLPALCSLALLAVLLPYFIPQILGVPLLTVAFGYFKGVLINFVFICVLLSFFWYIATAGSASPDLKNTTGFVLAATAAAVMYAHGLSYSIEEHAALPGLGLMFGYLLQRKGLSAVRKTFLTLFVFGFVLLSAGVKYASPYAWWGWIEPDIRKATVPLDLPETRYFRVSQYTSVIITDIVTIIKENTRTADTIYTFPNIPLFYVLSGRYPGTFGLVHYFDVCPDALAVSDVDKLRASPPKVIVSLDFLERTWQFHEKAFRQGRRSGQREISDFISEITSPQKKMYRQARKYLTPTGESLNVWVKLDDIAAKR